MDQKKLYRNYIYNSIYQFLILVVPLLVTPFVTRILGAEAIGQYSYTRSIVTYFILFGTVGSNMYAQRAIAYVNTNRHERSRVFWEILIFRCLLLFISLGIYVYFEVIWGRYPMLFLIQTLDIIAAMLDITWYFQGMEEFGKITFRNAIIKLISAALILCFIRDQSQLWLYILIYSLTNLLGQIWMWKDILSDLQWIPFRQLHPLKHTKEIVLLFIPQISIQIYLVIDKTMIELLTGDSIQTGYYELAQTIQRTAVTLVTAFGTAAASHVASLKNSNEQGSIRQLIGHSYELVSLTAFPLAFGIGAISHNFVPWFYGEGYEPVIYLLIILCPVIIVIGLSNISGIQYMVPMGMERQMTLCTLAGAIINVFFNYRWIPNFGALGAAVASLAAECIVLFLQTVFIRKIIIKRLLIRNIIQALISSIIMVLVIKLTETYLLLQPSLGHTFLLVAEGAFIYISIQLLLKNHLLLDMLRKVCQWRKNYLKRGDYEKNDPDQ